MNLSGCTRLIAPFLLAAGIAAAHVTPPLVILAERDAISTMTAGAARIDETEVRLTDPQRETIALRTGWKPKDGVYRFHVARSKDGAVVAVVVFLTEFTVHGPFRMGIGFAPDGRVQHARVTEMTEETYPWLKPLLDREFTRVFVGLDADDAFAPGEDVQSCPSEA